MAMAKHPDVLKKCQHEVDGVCGLERSPGIQDAQNLPYLRAVMQEVSKLI
jgi:cytochrome P450